MQQDRTSVINIEKADKIPGLIEMDAEMSKESPKSPFFPISQHKVNASVPVVSSSIPAGDEKELADKIEKLTSQIDKMKDEPMTDDHSSVLVKEYQEEIKELERELEKERKMKGQMQNTIEQLNGTVTGMGFELNKQNALLQAIKKKPEPKKPSEDPIQTLKDIKETVNKAVGEQQIFEDSIKEVQSKMESKEIVYENPKQLAIIIAQSMIKKIEKAKMDNGKRDGVERLAALRFELKQKIDSMDAGIEQQKTAIINQIELKSRSLYTFKNALEKLTASSAQFKNALSSLESSHEKEVAELQNERKIRQQEKGQVLSMVTELGKLKGAAATAARLKNKVEELEEELRKRGGESVIQMDNVTLSINREPSTEVVAATKVSHEELEKLQHYRDLIAKEKQIVEYSTQDLNKKKGEMTKLVMELNSKNRKLKLLESELKSIKGMYYKPTTIYKIISISLFCLVMLLLYSHLAKSDIYNKVLSSSGN